MTSKRLMGIGDSIMFSKNKESPRNNKSGLLDKSNKSLITNSTYATPQRKTNIKQLITPYTINKKDYNNKYRILTDLNNINNSNNNSRISNNNNNLNFLNYIHTEQNKKSVDLFNDADDILKSRKNNHLIMNHLLKSVYMKNSNDIRLENYKIKLITNKRNELNNKLNDINKVFKSTEKIFENDYKKFMLFVEKNDKSQKNQEIILNNIKNIFNEKEIEFNKLNEQNRKLKKNIELFVKQILVLKNYGSFINKVFKQNFIYENIQKNEDKSFLDIANELIKIYDKNNKTDFDDKLTDEYWLITQFKEYEINLINIINQKELYRKDFVKIDYFDKIEMDKLLKKKKELEKTLKIAQEEKDKFVKSIRTYDPPEYMDIVLNCIEELTNIIGNNNPSIPVLLKDKSESNYTAISSNLIKILKEKENNINNYINEIENILNGNNIDDKKLIEELILERKKEIKKEKLFELIKQQNEHIKKKNTKAYARANRIVIKGRKVIDFPYIKPKKKKKIIVNENHENDYLFYSSDEEKNENKK